MWSCKITRIHHWCSVGTKNPNPRATSQWETRLAEFPTGIMDPRVGIIMFPRNINDGFIFSHIIWRSTVRYLLVTSQLMFTKARSYNPFLVYCRELAPGTVSLTGDRAQGDDSKHDSHYMQKVNLLAAKNETKQSKQ